MSGLYFAYGSNMPSARLRARIPSAEPLGAARLEGFALRINKRGRDGTAKANLARARVGVVWGVVYRLAATDWEALDGFEGGYVRFEATVALRRGGELDVHTYRSDRLIEAVPPHAWYRELILEGAREHELPESWISQLRAIPRSRS